jgi:hypothetical protein
VINPDEPCFPNNVVAALAFVTEGIDEDLEVLKRPLRPTDPKQAVGIYGTLWQPDNDSFEMGHIVPGEPTLQSYQIGIQTLIKDGDSQRGLAASSVLSRDIRLMLYRNDPLRVALGSLYVEVGTSRESMRRWGIRSQRYLSNDIEGTFVFSSVIDMWIETETR